MTLRCTVIYQLLPFSMYLCLKKGTFFIWWLMETRVRSEAFNIMMKDMHIFFFVCLIDTGYNPASLMQKQLPHISKFEFGDDVNFRFFLYAPAKYCHAHIIESRCGLFRVQIFAVR